MLFLVVVFFVICVYKKGSWKLAKLGRLREVVSLVRVLYNEKRQYAGPCLVWQSDGCDLVPVAAGNIALRPGQYSWFSC